MQLIDSNSVILLDHSHEPKIQSLLQSYRDKDSKWKIVALPDNSVTHLIFCSECQHAWELYKPCGQSVRSNSSANILPHKCTKFHAPRIYDIDQCELTQAVRSKIVNKFTEILGKRPTVSVNSGVEIMNEACSFITDLTIKTRKNWKINISRHLYSQNQKEKALVVIESNRKIYFDNKNQAALIIDNWTSHGKNFIGILGRVNVNNKIQELLLDFKQANFDKSANGILSDIMPFLPKADLPIPVICDNCSTMVALEKHSSKLAKVYCIEHKLANFENKFHNYDVFKTIDNQLNLINSYFNYRDGKYSLPLKPLTTHSTTRPWRSHLKNYKIYVNNFTAYAQISATEPNFPTMPQLNTVQNLLEFEEKYCSNFDRLEKSSSNLNSALICYINLIYLFESNAIAKNLSLTASIIQELSEYILSPIACAFYVLSRNNAKGIFCTIISIF